MPMSIQNIIVLEMVCNNIQIVSKSRVSLHPKYADAKVHIDTDIDLFSISIQ